MPIPKNDKLINELISKLVLLLQTEMAKDSEVIKILEETKLNRVNPISFYQYFEVDRGKLQLLSIYNLYHGIFDFEKDGKSIKFLTPEDCTEVTKYILNKNTIFSINEKRVIEKITERVRIITPKNGEEIFKSIVDISLPYTFYIPVEIINGLLTIEARPTRPKIIFR